MKEEICLEVERWRQRRLKLGKTKSQEKVASGDLIMLCRDKKLEQPQFGLVLELLNHSRDAAIKLQSGYSFVTAVGNLVLCSQTEWTSRAGTEVVLIRSARTSHIL